MLTSASSCKGFVRPSIGLVDQVSCDQCPLQNHMQTCLGLEGCAPEPAACPTGRMDFDLITKFHSALKGGMHSSVLFGGPS